MSKIHWSFFGLGLSVVVGIGVAHGLIASAPAPTMLWYLVATAAGCFAAAAVAAAFRSLRELAITLAAAGAIAAFWPAVAIISAAF